MTGYVATADTEIDAPAERVWAALTEPSQIEKYMFGSKVVTDWEPGSTILWRGEHEGTSYEDKGEIVEVVPERRLKMTHFSPMSGQDDIATNYHTLVYELEQRGGTTHISLSQDNNANEEEAEHSGANWQRMLRGLKEIVEDAKEASPDASAAVNDDRCPVCGQGTLIDLAFDAGSRLGGKPAQSAGSRQISSYSCGHTAKGPRLDGADQEELEVERRTSSDVTDTEAP